MQGRPFLTPLSRCAEALREACDEAMVLTTNKSEVTWWPPLEGGHVQGRLSLIPFSRCDTA